MKKIIDILIDYVMPVLVCTTLLLGSCILAMQLSDILDYGFNHHECCHMSD